MKKIEITVSLIKRMKVSQEDLDYLLSVAEEGDAQAFNEFTEVDNEGAMGVTRLDESPSERVKVLEAAIRKHREQTGHNMCWENDEELWSALGDGVTIDHTVPPWPEFMTKCAAYRASKDQK